jgi:hypothetical protein
MSSKTAQTVFLLSLIALTGCSLKKESKKTVSPSPVPAVETTDSEASTPLKVMDVNEY